MADGVNNSLVRAVGSEPSNDSLVSATISGILVSKKIVEGCI